MLKKLMRDIVDALDGAGREFKTGFSGAFRKRGGKHRADADRIRAWDRRNSDHSPQHRRADKPRSHAKEYNIVTDAVKGWYSRDHVPQHRAPDYNAARDLGQTVGQDVRNIPGDVFDEVKGVPKKVPQQIVEELYEDAIGQDDPDAYGRDDSGSMKFLAPASEAEELRNASPAEVAARFGLDAGSLGDAEIKITVMEGTRFARVEITGADAD